MFRKIISNLAYSPAMIWKLSRFNFELNKEKTISIWLTLVILLNLIFLSFLYIFDNQTPYKPYANPKLEEYATTTSNGAIKLSITAINNSEGGRKINSGDLIDADNRIRYVFVVENTSSEPLSASIKTDLSDLLDYAKLVDSDIVDLPRLASTESIVNLGPLEKSEASLVADTTPAPAGPQSGTSNDCVASVKLGESTLSFVPKCSIIKRLDVMANSFMSRFPEQESMLIVTIFAFSLLLLIKILYVLRILITKREISVIRKILNTGGING